MRREKKECVPCPIQHKKGREAHLHIILLKSSHIRVEVFYHGTQHFV